LKWKWFLHSFNTMKSGMNKSFTQCLIWQIECQLVICVPNCSGLVFPKCAPNPNSTVG
jgi:hypothetical protein